MTTAMTLSHAMELSHGEWDAFLDTTAASGVQHLNPTDLENHSYFVSFGQRTSVDDVMCIRAV